MLFSCSSLISTILFLDSITIFFAFKEFQESYLNYYLFCSGNVKIQDFLRVLRLKRCGLSEKVSCQIVHNIIFITSFLMRLILARFRGHFCKSTYMPPRSSQHHRLLISIIIFFHRCLSSLMWAGMGKSSLKR